MLNDGGAPGGSGGNELSPRASKPAFGIDEGGEADDMTDGVGITTGRGIGGNAAGVGIGSGTPAAGAASGCGAVGGVLDG